MARRRVGGVGSTRGKRAGAILFGDAELMKRVRRMTDQMRAEVLQGAVDQASEETAEWESQLAPRAAGAGTRGYHGADWIVVQKAWERRRDRRSNRVGPEHRRGRHLLFQEFGTVHHEPQPFIRPVVRRMRQRTLEIVAERARKAAGL